ncbi:MAG TPA: transposase [Verrucomicrobiae bacterium]|nr:transposase [Verrucomicrobiae bacterium]
MARPVRIDVAGGWYHVTARGNERRAVFYEDADRRHFIELLGELAERFGLRVHAYVLMPNHYHLLVETPQANLSRAMQWANVSYSVWFNRRHQRVGHLFQGRFKAIILDRDESALELSRYLHLNPVRVKRLGLDKVAHQRSRTALAAPPDAGTVAKRMSQLRRYPWSSYRAYAGFQPPPSWLRTGTVLGLHGGHPGKAQRVAYRQYVESAAREGLVPSPWERLQAGVVLGGTAFVGRLRTRLRGNDREQSGLRHLKARPTWEQAVRVVERLKGEKWDTFCDRHGDSGRDLALYLGRKRCGLTLRELAIRSSGIDYVSVATAVRRFAHRAAKDPKQARLISHACNQLNNE